MSGGCTLDDEATIIAQAGPVLGGSATIWADYNVTLENDEWSVIADGAHNVPPWISTGYAYCWLILVGDDLHYRIIHNGIPPLDQASIRGPAEEWQATTGILLDTPWTSPIIGKITLPTATDVPITKDMVRNGLVYLQFSDEGEYIRAQIVRTSAKMGGHAQEIHDIDMSGGMLADGATPQYSQRNVNMSGGVVADGQSRIWVRYTPYWKGNGLRANSKADVAKNYNVTIGGGIRVDGKPGINWTYNATMSGGILLDKTNVYSLTIPVGFGSIKLGGSGNEVRFLWPPMSEGIKINGAHVQTFIDYYDGSTGCRLSGRAKIEFFKHHYSVARRGYCRAMADTNICTVVVDTKTELISPDKEISPPLSDDRLEILETGEWRDITEINDYGVLPKIIQNIQNNCLPPKESTRKKATSLNSYAYKT